ncbi:hypothetical protein PIB30_037048 [Stylosanthes scabra]|uniref:Ubiquitin-like protease family profile domain-containing protein n=1 Tax=Stylosanthes scabra TaxID=79078 RepID=A0ABU6UCA5_9FABA|nr:hypothetical protein [Stylosanthes scabra]
MGKKNVEKKRKAVAKPEKKKIKNQGHEFRCLPKTVAQMFIYLQDHPDKRALVDEIGFETSYDTKVAKKALSQEDSVIHAFFQWKTTVTLQDLIKTTTIDGTAEGLMESPEEMVTHVLLSMNQEESAPPFDLGVDETQPTQDDNRVQQLGDQCKTLDSLHQRYQTAPNKKDMEERYATWATVENDNKFETIFQLRGPKTIEVMRYNFMTMAPTKCIDLQMVSLMCHVLNREESTRFERDVYYVPPEILTRMFDTYDTNYLDKKTKLPYLVSEMKDQEYMELLDREKLRTHSVLFAPVLYSHHWWLFVLDVDNKEFYSTDFVYSITPNQQRNKLHIFALLDAAMLSGCYTFKCQYNLEEWGQDQLDEFRKKIVSRLILSKENTLRVEAINQANKMGCQTNTSAALKSP